MNWPVPDFALAMLLALIIDAAIGWPDAVFNRIGHPVTWLGKLIEELEKRLNHATNRRFKGTCAAMMVIGTASGLAALLAAMSPDGYVGVLIMAVLAWPLIAVRSMHEHVKAVSTPLKDGDIAASRQALSMIVGRDPSQLDEAGIARAGMESLAENTSDGIVAPVFWGVLFGLPGIAAYKAINTLDSMIGHRNERYEAFGWASAKTDDVVNSVPARLTGMLYVLVSGNPARAMRVMMNNAHKHRSPNAGWPEAALAGALDVRLSGPRVYDGELSQEPWVNGAGRDADAEQLVLGLRLYVRLIFALCGLLAVIASLAIVV
ncbi:MAG: adenosylcobinamide-phosphate synthase CbiB [Anderseniella sp.]